MARSFVKVRRAPPYQCVDNIRRWLQRAMKETGLLNSQDIDRVVNDSLDEDGEEIVADDAKKEAFRYDWSAEPKSEEQK